jgi:hypothetical protein
LGQKSQPDKTILIDVFAYSFLKFLCGLNSPTFGESKKQGIQDIINVFYQDCLNNT